MSEATTQEEGVNIDGLLDDIMNAAEKSAPEPTTVKEYVKAELMRLDGQGSLRVEDVQRVHDYALSLPEGSRERTAFLQATLSPAGKATYLEAEFLADASLLMIADMAADGDIKGVKHAIEAARYANDALLAAKLSN